MAFITLVLATLISFNIMSLSLYYTLNFLYGLLIGLDIPARKSIVPNIVPAEALSKALPVYNATFQIALFIGPVFGSFIVTMFGFKVAYFANTISFSAILFAVWKMNIPRQIQTVSVKRTLFSDLKNVGSVLKLHRELMFLIVLNFLLVALGKIDYLFPALASGILHVGIDKAGWLNSSLGIGYVIGAFLFGSFDQVFQSKTNRVLLGYILLLGVTAFLISIWHSLLADSVMLIARGILASIGGVLIATVVQTRSPSEHLGKVTGLQTALLSLVSMMTFPIGLLTDLLGIGSVLKFLAVSNFLLFMILLSINKKHANRTIERIDS